MRWRGLNKKRTQKACTHSVCGQPVIPALGNAATLEFNTLRTTVCMPSPHLIQPEHRGRVSLFFTSRAHPFRRLRKESKAITEWIWNTHSPAWGHQGRCHKEGGTLDISAGKNRKAHCNTSERTKCTDSVGRPVKETVAQTPRHGSPGGLRQELFYSTGSTEALGCLQSGGTTVPAHPGKVTWAALCRIRRDIGWGISWVPLQ